MPKAGGERASAIAQYLAVEEPQYPVVDLLRPLDEEEVANARNTLDLRVRAEEGTQLRRCVGIESDAAVVRAMEVQRGLGRRAPPSGGEPPSLGRLGWRSDGPTCAAQNR